MAVRPRFLLVRHGQSEWQVGASRDLDSPLTRLGHIQSERLGDWLVAQGREWEDLEHGFTAMYTSPMKRAVETAAHVSSRTGKTFVELPELQEAGFSVTDNLCSASSPFTHWRKPVPRPEYLGFQATVRKVFAQLCENMSDRGASLVVTHAGLIRTLLGLAFETDKMSVRLYNTGLCRLDWVGGRWQLTAVNVCEHLPNSLRTV